MILGRNTQQWLGLITAFFSMLETVLIVAFPNRFDPVVMAVIFGAVTGFLGVFIAFIAQTQTTPTSDPQLKEGTMVRVTDESGVVVAHTPVVGPDKAEPANAEDGDGPAPGP